MKKVLILVCLLFVSSLCFAAEFSANFQMKTGDASLDLHLSNVNAKAATSTGAKEIRTELAQNYSLSEKQINFLSKQGYTLAEIQYLALLAKQSGKSVESVAALHGKGVGWGILAHRLGVQPSVLRKLIVQEKKVEKKREMPIKEERVKPMMKEPPAGGGRGRGRK